MTRETIKRYYQLTKPGIIRGNMITGAAGFLLAARGSIDWWLLAALLAGMSLVIAAGCVFNNYLDRGIDRRMARTKDRALATHQISNRNALIYGAVLAVLGFAILLRFTNALVAAIGLFALISYVIVYAIGKRRSIHGTMIGCVPGAMPPVAGYVAVTHRIDIGAFLLFLLLFFWQLPHFYSIAIYRLGDYKAAKLPVMPAVKGVEATKLLITLYVAAFILAAGLLTATGYAGYTYLAVMLVIGGWWLQQGVRGFKVTNNDKWARQMFGSSLLALMVFSVMISVTNFLP